MKILSLKLVIYMSFVLLGFSTISQGQQFDNFHFESGLRSEFIKTVSKGPDGLLWVGTSEGLYKFDGYDFEKVITDGIGSNSVITKILLTSDNSLWIATHTNTLHRLKDGIWSSNITTKYSTKIKKIKAMTEFNNELLIATNHGIYTYKLNNNKLEQKKIDQIDNHNFNITSMRVFDNELIIACVDKILIFNKQFSLLKTIKMHKKNTYIHDMFYNEKNLWLGTNQGLLKFNLIDENFIPAEATITSRVLSIISVNNSIWVSSLEQGLFRIDMTSGKSNHYNNSKEYPASIASNHLSSLFLSENGTLWIGSFDHGLIKFNTNSLPFKFYSQQTVQNNCFTTNEFHTFFQEEKDSLFVANSNALIQITPSGCNKLNLNSSGLIYSFRMKSDKLWLSTTKGLVVFQQSKSQFKKIEHILPQKSVMFSVNFNNAIYIGTFSGLYKYSNGVTVQLLNKDYKIFGYKLKNNLFFQTSKGIYKLTKDKSLLPIIEENLITAFFVDSTNRIPVVHLGKS